MSPLLRSARKETHYCRYHASAKLKPFECRVPFAVGTGVPRKQMRIVFRCEVAGCAWCEAGETQYVEPYHMHRQGRATYMEQF